MNIAPVVSAFKNPEQAAATSKEAISLIPVWWQIRLAVAGKK